MNNGLTIGRGSCNMWPYTDDEADFLSLPKQEKSWKMSDWYWERYKSKCLNELAPLADHTKPFTDEEAEYFRFAA